MGRLTLIGWIAVLAISSGALGALLQRWSRPAPRPRVGEQHTVCVRCGQVDCTCPSELRGPYWQHRR